MERKVKQKILIVDDKAENLFALEQILRPTMADIIKATSGNEALIASLDHEFALAILDVQMPLMDGYELAEYLRSAEETRRLPIIFLSAVYSDDFHVFKGYEAGAVDFITKPYSPAILLSKVEIFLQLDQQKRELLENIELERSKSYLENILLSMTESVLVVSRETIIQTVNGACMALLGYRQDEIIGMPIVNILADEDYSAWVHELETSRTQEFRNREAWFKSKSGENIPVLLSGAAFRNTLEVIPGAVLVARDIREQKAAEEALRRSEAKYRELVENAPSIILRLNHQGEITFFNEYAQQFFGYPEHEIIGRKMVGTILPDDPGGTDPAVLSREMEHHPGRHTSSENENICRNGERVWISWTKKEVRDQDGNIVEVLCIGNDQTVRRRLETQLRQAQKLEAIGTMAGGIAHDFNNILGIILGYSELSMMAGSSDASLRTKSLQEVCKAAHRAKDLVRRILLFARQSEEELRPLQVGLIVEEALKMLRSSLPSTIEMRRNVNLSGIVVADPTQIHQIIMNLCTNSHHAMREQGGVLSVSLENIDLDAASALYLPDLHPGPYMKLTVSDTGRGIDSSVIDRIFDPYFTTKGRGEGTGLGLAVVHGIVKGLGGAIKVQSEVGKGTAFEIFLPREKETEAKTEPISPAAVPTGKESILLVDDEIALSAMAARMLENLGYHVTAATDSGEAFELFRSNPHRFDLVITDQTMPRLTGAELARQILSLRPDIPIILCTGFSDLVDRESAEAIGIRAFMMKPVTMTNLAETVRKALDVGSIDDPVKEEIARWTPND